MFGISWTILIIIAVLVLYFFSFISFSKYIKMLQDQINKYITDHIKPRLDSFSAFMKEKEEQAKDQSSKVAYKIDLYIEPEWEEIIRYCIPELKNNEQYIDFINKLFADEKLEYDDVMLWGKSFSYVIFHDEFSGMKQIWCNRFKNFVDEIEIRGHIFGHNNNLFDKFRDKKLNQFFHIEPEFIGFEDTFAYPGHPYRAPIDVKLSEIPYYSIIYYLKKYYMQYRYNKDDYIEFPQPELIKILDKSNVKYEGWHEYGSYLFSSKYYSLFIDIALFYPEQTIKRDVLLP